MSMFTSSASLRMIIYVALGLSLVSSFWEPDTFGWIGVIGLIGLSFSNNEFLGLFMLLTPASALVDLVRIFGAGKLQIKALWVILDICEIIAKVVGGTTSTKPAAEALLSRHLRTYAAGSGGAYTNFDAQREDPFANYNPPQPTPNLY